MSLLAAERLATHVGVDRPDLSVLFVTRLGQKGLGSRGFGFRFIQAIAQVLMEKGAWGLGKRALGFRVQGNWVWGLGFGAVLGLRV